jgi:hypothetical protein
MTAEKYAIVDGDAVVNTILLDENDKYTPPSGFLILPATDNVSIGWQRVGSEWVAPEITLNPQMPDEDPDVTAAKDEAVQELINAGISEGAARRIVGLPPLT